MPSPDKPKAEKSEIHVFADGGYREFRGQSLGGGYGICIVPFEDPENMEFFMGATLSPTSSASAEIMALKEAIRIIEKKNLHKIHKVILHTDQSNITTQSKGSKKSEGNGLKITELLNMAKGLGIEINYAPDLSKTITNNEDWENTKAGKKLPNHLAAAKSCMGIADILATAAREMLLLENKGTRLNPANPNEKLSDNEAESLILLRLRRGLLRRLHLPYALDEGITDILATPLLDEQQVAKVVDRFMSTLNITELREEMRVEKPEIHVFADGGVIKSRDKTKAKASGWGVCIMPFEDPENIKLYLGADVGVVDSFAAEITAIKNALEIIKANNLHKTHNVTLYTDQNALITDRLRQFEGSTKTKNDSAMLKELWTDSKELGVTICYASDLYNHTIYDEGMLRFELKHNPEVPPKLYTTKSPISVAHTLASTASNLLFLEKNGSLSGEKFPASLSGAAAEEAILAELRGSLKHSLKLPYAAEEGKDDILLTPLLDEQQAARVIERFMSTLDVEDLRIKMMHDIRNQDLARKVYRNSPPESFPKPKLHNPKDYPTWEEMVEILREVKKGDKTP